LRNDLLFLIIRTYVGRPETTDKNAINCIFKIFINKIERINTQLL